MAAPFPHHYQVTLKGEPGAKRELLAPPRPAIVGGPPPEFDGRPEWWSPEHLLLGSLCLCLMTTFESFATRHVLRLLHYRTTAEGTLEKTQNGLAFTRIAVHVDITVPGPEVTRATELFDRAKRACIISNSLRAPVEVEATLHAG